MLAQLGHPDMRTPIAQALAFPDRVDTGVASSISCGSGALNFSAPDHLRFPCIALAAAALDVGGNGAGDPQRGQRSRRLPPFLDSRIRYTDIAPACTEALARLPTGTVQCLDDAIAADAEARAGRAELAQAPQGCLMERDDENPRISRGARHPRRVPELGHYVVARWCKVKVLRFSIGFGRVVWARRFGADHTEWAVSAIPLGGYVKMLDEREGRGRARGLWRARSIGRASASALRSSRRDRSPTCSSPCFSSRGRMSRAFPDNGHCLRRHPRHARGRGGDS
jgi:hypothetical protein